MFSPPADSLNTVLGVAVQGAYSYAVGGHGETAGSCPRSTFPNKGLPLPNKCPPQSVIDHFTPPPPPPPFAGPFPPVSPPLLERWQRSRRAAVPSPVLPELRRFHFHVRSATVLSLPSAHLPRVPFLRAFSSVITRYPGESGPESGLSPRHKGRSSPTSLLISAASLGPLRRNY